MGTYTHTNPLPILGTFHRDAAQACEAPLLSRRVNMVLPAWGQADLQLVWSLGLAMPNAKEPRGDNAVPDIPYPPHTSLWRLNADRATENPAEGDSNSSQHMLHI